MEIVVVDDHRIVRVGINSLIEKEEEIKLIKECSSVSEAKKFLDETDKLPDIILTDISMPGESGVELISYVRNKYPDVAVIVLSMHDDLQYVTRSLSMGAKGYVLKTSVDDLVVAMKTVYNGGVFFSNPVTNMLAEGMFGKSTQGDLSVRELEVLHLICEGYNSKEIGNELCISERTVSNHRTNIMKKLSVKNTAELVRMAIERKLV